MVVAFIVPAGPQSILFVVVIIASDSWGSSDILEVTSLSINAFPLADGFWHQMVLFIYCNRAVLHPDSSSRQRPRVVRFSRREFEVGMRHLWYQPGAGKVSYKLVRKVRVWRPIFVPVYNCGNQEIEGRSGVLQLRVHVSPRCWLVTRVAQSPWSWFAAGLIIEIVKQRTSPFQVHDSPVHGERRRPPSYLWKIMELKSRTSAQGATNTSLMSWYPKGKEFIWTATTTWFWGSISRSQAFRGPVMWMRLWLVVHQTGAIALQIFILWIVL